jgi:O-methyltransferase
MISRRRIRTFTSDQSLYSFEGLPLSRTMEFKNEVWRSPYDRLTGARKLRFRVEQCLAVLAWRLGYRLQARMDMDFRSPWYDPTFVKNYGEVLSIDSDAAGEARWEDKHDLIRRDMLLILANWLRRHGVTGAVAEVGVADGMTASLLCDAFPASEIFLFDTMSGYFADDIVAEQARTSMNVGEYPRKLEKSALVEHMVRAADRTHFYEGAFPSSIGSEVTQQNFCFVHLDVDLYKPTLSALKFFFPLMCDGSMIVVHDYNAWPGARAAVDEFLLQTNQSAVPMPDKSGSVAICVRHPPHASN